jgi:hypothetical protein
MWLIDSAAGSSKAALVSSICCKFVCRSLPATQQPNMGYGSRAGWSTAGHDHPSLSSTGLHKGALGATALHQSVSAIQNLKEIYVNKIKSQRGGVLGRMRLRPREMREQALSSYSLKHEWVWAFAPTGPVRVALRQSRSQISSLLGIQHHLPKRQYIPTLPRDHDRRVLQIKVRSMPGNLPASVLKMSAESVACLRHPSPAAPPSSGISRFFRSPTDNARSGPSQYTESRV